MRPCPHGPFDLQGAVEVDLRARAHTGARAALPPLPRSRVTV